MKRLLTLIFLLLSTPAWGAVALQGGTCTEDEPTGTTTHDLTHTVSAGSTYLIAFAAHLSSLDITTSMTWDFGGTAQAMTERGAMDLGTVSGKVFDLVNPTVGTLTLREVSDQTATPHLIICSVTGVDTANPRGTIVETESTATDTGDSLAFTLSAGGLAIAFLITEGGSALPGFAHGASQTQVINEAAGCGGGCNVFLTTATVSPMDYTWTSAGADYWHVVVPLNPATTRRVFQPIFFD